MKRTRLGFLMLFLAFNSWSQSGNTMSLNDAKDFALENNYAVKNAYLDIEIAHKQSLEATSMGLPQVNFDGSFSNFINLPVQVVDASFINPNAKPGETVQFRAGTEYSAAGTLNASQLLFNGSYIVGLQVSKFFINFQETAAQQTKEDILFNVTQAYQIASVGKDNLAFVDSMTVLTEQLLNDQRAFFDLGLINQEELDQIEYSLISAQTAQTSARIQYENSLALLKLTMGYPMNQELEITQSSKDLLGAASLKDASNGYNQNLTLELMHKQLTLSEYNLKNYKYSQMPTLGAFFQQTYNAYRNEFNFFANEKWYPQTLWGLKLNIPIFSGGEKYAQIAQAKIEVMKNEYNIKQFEQNLQMQEVQYQNNLLGAQRKLEMQEKNIQLASKIYKNALTRKEIGSTSSLEVTQKYNQLMAAQTQYIGSLVEVFNAKLNLDKLYNNILNK